MADKLEPARIDRQGTGVWAVQANLEIYVNEVWFGYSAVKKSCQTLVLVHAHLP
jgi:hypothetical protein